MDSFLTTDQVSTKTGQVHTYASWLNQVERWFGIVTQMAIRRGSFSNVRELVNKIDLFVEHYNERATPFM